MSIGDGEWDAVSVVVAIAVFALPLTLLFPGISVWDVIPKIRVSRFHVLDQHLTWLQLNASMIFVIVIFFCFYLEIRKRELDEMVDGVLSVSQATEAALDMECERQTAAIRVCVKLLDASTEHYENLMLLRDDLRKREKTVLQRPPEILPSTSDIRI
ncbi:unnamed protein product [Danaus chrysippus]|uniref:(African queen) hypothetical protein n=1 Tax=Danaus chrysippus TaxID=151541 RepID=A0A8J2VVC0_9NEOP|nr:unnamed protein product [Danaus chrysippus]